MLTVTASNIILALATILNWALYAYMWLIIGRAVISWVSPDPYNPIVVFLYRATEPVLRPIRKRLPFAGGIDLSPLVVLAVIMFLQIAVIRTLTAWAIRLSFK